MDPRLEQGKSAKNLSPHEEEVSEMTWYELTAAFSFLVHLFCSTCRFQSRRDTSNWKSHRLLLI